MSVTSSLPLPCRAARGHAFALLRRSWLCRPVPLLCGAVLCVAFAVPCSASPLLCRAPHSRCSAVLGIAIAFPSRRSLPSCCALPCNASPCPCRAGPHVAVAEHRPALPLPGRAGCRHATPLLFRHVVLCLCLAPRRRAPPLLRRSSLCHPVPLQYVAGLYIAFAAPRLASLCLCQAATRQALPLRISP